VRNKLNATDFLQHGMIVLMLVWFAIFLVIPIVMIFSKAFQDKAGAFVGFANFQKYFETPALMISIWNSVDVSVMTMLISVTLAFMFAYGLTRTSMKAKPVYRYLAMLPIFVPTMVHGLSLIYLFGKMGIFSKLGMPVDLGGRTSIIIAEVIYTFPQAFMILTVALENADYRLYESAASLGAGPVKTFFGVTLPSAKYGIISACAVCFTLCFTDFGAPQVVGERFLVLSTSIYKQVAGQQNMVMGSVVGVLLTIPAVIAFVVDQTSQKKANSAEVSSKAVAFRITKNFRKDLFYQIYCTLLSLTILTVFTAVIAAAMTKRWPYDLALTLKHFDFGAKLIGGGISSFATSVKISLATAVFGTMIVFTSAYLVQKTTRLPGIRKMSHFLAMMPMALPGMVIGLSYIMFFNKPNFAVLGSEVSNPFTVLYQTLTIMVISNVVHMFSVTYVTATTALKKLDKEYENVSDSMNVPFYRTFLHITVPMSVTAIMEIVVYFFVNSMVTVSALVFLYSAKNRPAAMAILSMDDNGDYAAAAAMSVVILLCNIGVRVIYEISLRSVLKRINRWKTGAIQASVKAQPADANS
jgi:iron(III) transport system permease protein